MTLKENIDLILETSLQTYFYDELSSLNKKSLNPIPKETIYYSSRVLDKYMTSDNFFELEEGKYKNKILGMKLMEASSLEGKRKKRMLREVGDTALFLCGFFSEYLNKRLVDESYYIQIGRSAYERLDPLEPEFFEFPKFYRILSSYFGEITNMMSIVAQSGFDNQDSHLYVGNFSGIKAS